MNKCFYCGGPVKNKYCNVSCQNRHQNTDKFKKLRIKKKEEIKKFKVSCAKCNKEFEVEENEKNFPKKDKYFCSRSCANSRIFTKDIIDKIWTEDKKNKAKKKSQKINKKYWTKERKKEQSLRMLDIVRKNPDSYSAKNVSGRTKIYEYKGTKVKGKWELLVAETLDFENIKWTNNIKPIPYYWKKSWHLYFPDFYLLDHNIYIEVKGYKTKRDEAKWKVIKHMLLVLQSKEIRQIKEKKLSINGLLV